MNITKQLKMNTITSLINRIVRIVSGLILPRLILLYFGSRTNGMVTSVNQFLNIITFLDLGVGSVIQSALYKPLVRKDITEVSRILSAARNYFKKIAYALIIYIIGLIIVYPYMVDSSNDFFSTAFLIVALSISLFGQYYFGIVNELLLNANQQAYIQYASEIIVVILNLIICLILIVYGAPIQIVKFFAGLIFLIRPVFLSYYVNKNFEIIRNVEVNGDPLPQKWSGMGQHISYSISNGAPVVILTIFSTLENISIFNIHNIVVQAIKMVVSSLTTEMNSFFGNLLAKNEVELLKNYFAKIEWIVHTGVIFLYGMAIVLINSFVQIYTLGVDDIDYYAPLFSLLLVLANAAYSLRSPYQLLIFSAGHFQQTQKSSFIEAGINIILSILMVNRFGLTGVTFGTLLAMAYRTVYLVMYLSKNILYRPIKIFIKQIFVDLISLGGIYFLGTIINQFYVVNNIAEWIRVAIILGIVNIVFLFLLNQIFYRNIVNSVIKSVFKR